MIHGRAISRTQRQLLLLAGALAISISMMVVPVDSSGPKALKPLSGSRAPRAGSHLVAANAAATVQLSPENLNVSEGDGFVLINVTRTGDTATAATVDYATLDGTAGQRTKYEIAAGTIGFAAGETTKTIQLLINDNNYLDGPQTFYLSLSNASGASLGLPSLATITINDNDVTPASVNLLDDARTFVRQQYYDFLSRYPDASGWDYWTNQITQCGTDALCLHNKRIDVSNAIFYELEYQQTGAYVFRLYRAAFGNAQPFPNPDNSNQAEAGKLPSYAVFAQTRARVVGGANLTQGQIAAANEFTLRPEFLAKYPASQGGPAFVDALVANVLSDLGVDLTLQRNALINLFNSGGRGAVLYRLADDSVQTNPVNNRALIDEEYNRAFVATQYYGYLRRDADIGGFLFWLGQVNGAPLRDVPRQHAMVCSFITSEEYLERFSPLATRSNSDCQFGGPTGDQAPAVNAGVEQTVSLPQNTVTLSGLVTDDGLPVGGALTTQWSKTSGPGTVNFSNPTLTTTFATFSVEGTYLLRLFASDGQLTNASFVRVKVLPANVPPDPIAVAPPIDETIATTIYDSTKFLYTGNPPIQTGVAPGTIKPIQAAVLRGRVVGRDNLPLAGAKVTVLNHTEFGQTFSRADGMFDMAVNGGGLLTVSYTKDGYLPLQRQMNVRWQDYSMVHDVAMIPFDPNVATIDLNANTAIQVARGGKVIDSPAPRQATLLFKHGTTATMTLPNGSTQPLTMLHVRATEYTVGSMGPAAMPGALPGTSAYTYASEYSIDEAVAAGATEVRFNQPVAQYNENFLNFPVGTIIPSGAYDKQKGQWVASESGRVVKILSVTGGAVDLDVNGAGQPATDAEYQTLGINAAERAQLVQLYTVNQSVWRVPLIHFTGWDANWGFGAPAGAAPPGGPNGSTPLSAGGPGPPCTSCPCTQPGCILGLIGQTLSEAVDLTGTPFYLRYDSNRTPGYKAGYTLSIPLSGAILPGPVKGIELSVTVAGRMFTQTYPAQINETAIFSWDGLDAYMRVVQGQQIATIDIGYTYDGAYQNTVNFGYNGNGVPITGDRTRQELTLHQIQHVPIGVFDFHPLSLGGWSLSAQHVYDPVGRTLYQGDGTIRNVQSVNAVIATVAGSGAQGFSGDGGQATAAAFNFPFASTTAPNGELYIADSVNRRIRKVDLAGIVTTVVGNGADCTPTLLCGDGGQAINAQLAFPSDITFGQDGSLYIFDAHAYRVRKVAPGGVITTVAGNGQLCGDPTSGCGDGGLATQAQLSTTATCCRYNLIVALDGTLYLTDAGNHRVRRVGTDGIISTIAGNGRTAAAGGCTVVGGTPVIAANACLSEPLGVAAAADGSVYFTDIVLNQIFRVTVDGFIHVVAGDGVCGNTGDGGPALNARICSPHGLALGPDGAIVFSDWSNARIRRIDANGIVTNYAGTGVQGFSGDGGPATAAQMRQSLQVSSGADGAIYISETNNHRIRRIFPPLPGFTNTDIAIPSTDGDELYVFDANGRHLRTVNTLTGANVYTFAYDSAGHVSSVTDGDGNVTAIERNGTGQPTGILSPYNQRTTLSLDGNGYLTGLTNPTNQSSQFTYTAGGLLTKKQDPRGNQNTFTYDALGRLARDDDAATGFQTLSRADQGLSYTVTHNTALGRLTLFAVQSLVNDDLKRIGTLPDGTQSQSIERPNGTETATEADGTITNITRGPDPRWKMQAPVTTSATITTLGGLNSVATFARSVTLATAGNPLSLTAQTDTLNINGVNYTSVYTAANRTFNDTTPLGRQRTTVIDPLGRITQRQFANLNGTSYAYDARGRLASATFGTGSEARIASFSYNTGGFLSSSTDPLGRIVAYSYDAAGRPTQQTLADGRVVGYSYDAKGNLASITPPGRTAHTFTFTQVDLLSSYSPPNVGTGSNATNYTYNLDRDLTRITRPDSQQINFAYDMAGRVSTLTTPSGQYSYAYNINSGNLSGITAPGNNALAYTYDGALPTRTTWTGTIAGNVSQTYDNSFRPASQSVNGASTVNFTYNNDRLLTGAGSLALTRNAQNGLVTGTSLGNVADTIGYNNFAEPISYAVSFNSTNLFAATYTRDKLGRISQQVETIGGVTSTYAYSYDQSGRLSAVTLNNGAQPIATYTYDSNSNRMSANIAGFISNGTYDAQDRLTQYGATTYSYTANGELQSKTAGGQTTTYNYDVLGNLKGATLPGGTQIDYVIDGQDRRVGKKLNGILIQGFLYQNQLAPVAELDGNNTVVSRFVYGNRRNMPDYMMKNGVAYRFITDHLGSVRFVVDSSTGVVAQRLDYDEFGIVLMDTNPGFQPFGFAGGLYDSQTGLLRFGARDYDAQTGRWTVQDPILFAGGDANLYGYVFNDPVNLKDRTGHDTWMNDSDSIFSNWMGQPPGQQYYPSPPKDPNPFPAPSAPKPGPQRPKKCPADGSGNPNDPNYNPFLDPRYDPTADPGRRLGDDEGTTLTRDQIRALVDGLDRFSYLSGPPTSLLQITDSLRSNLRR